MYMHVKQPSAVVISCPAQESQCGVNDFIRFADAEPVHPEPTLFHSFYNHHVETIETIENTVKHGL